MRILAGQRGAVLILEELFRSGVIRAPFFDIEGYVHSATRYLHSDYYMEVLEDTPKGPRVIFKEQGQSDLERIADNYMSKTPAKLAGRGHGNRTRRTAKRKSFRDSQKGGSSSDATVDDSTRDSKRTKSGGVSEEKRQMRELAERLKVAEEEIERRKAAEAETARLKAAEAEMARLKAAEAETARLKAEAETARLKAAEAETARLKEEAEQLKKQRDQAINDQLDGLKAEVLKHQTRDTDETELKKQKWMAKQAMATQKTAEANVKALEAGAVFFDAARSSGIGEVASTWLGGLIPVNPQAGKSKSRLHVCLCFYS